MGAWEQSCNKNFNVTEYSNIKNMAGTHGYILSTSKWIQKNKVIKK